MFPHRGNSPIQQNNGPGDGGEASYEQIYAPSRLGGEDGPQVDLPNSGEGGEVIGEARFPLELMILKARERIRFCGTCGGTAAGRPGQR